MKQTDIIIIGSGVSALQLAHHLSAEFNVMIITKGSLIESNSYLAQGGIAAVMGEQDHYEKHIQDTLEAGRSHNDVESVHAVTKEGPILIEELLQHGCPFDRDVNGEIVLGLEGAHREKRIVHAGGDATGKAVVHTLLEKIKGQVHIMEHFFVYDLVMDGERCIGVKGRNKQNQNEVYEASHIVIATGGCGQLYPYTSNAQTVTGDGIALAYRAGASVVDMEFIQFHPTMLYADGKVRGLISEAVRGEGAILVTDDGHPIMEGVHPQKDLAPRHIVSQTIDRYLKNGIPIFLYAENVKEFTIKFPTITALCRRYGIDAQTELIPVVPGSHFLMGGIKTDLIGRTSISGLYAIGEAACTQFHGANRLASNSLLEGLYMGKMLAEWLKNQPRYWMVERMAKKKDRATPEKLPTIQAIQQSMMEHVGIMRQESGLHEQKEWLNQFQVAEWLDAPLDELDSEKITRVFLLITASLITEAALKRTESRGGHYRLDYPFEDPSWLRKSIIHRKEEQKDEHIKIKTAT